MFTSARPHPVIARLGFSLTELQVALVVFGMALTGLCPLVVLQAKQLKKFQGRLNPQTTYYLVPSADSWARKLGAGAQLLTQPPGTRLPMPAPIPAKDVTNRSLEKSLVSGNVTGQVSVQAITP